MIPARSRLTSGAERSGEERTGVDVVVRSAPTGSPRISSVADGDTSSGDEDEATGAGDGVGARSERARYAAIAVMDRTATADAAMTLARLDIRRRLQAIVLFRTFTSAARHRLIGGLTLRLSAPMVRASSRREHEVSRKEKVIRFEG
jgi:hypothetical protein